MTNAVSGLLNAAANWYANEHNGHVRCIFGEIDDLGDINGRDDTAGP